MLFLNELIRKREYEELRRGVVKVLWCREADICGDSVLNLGIVCVIAEVVLNELRMRVSGK